MKKYIMYSCFALLGIMGIIVLILIQIEQKHDFWSVDLFLNSAITFSTILFLSNIFINIANILINLIYSKSNNKGIKITCSLLDSLSRVVFSVSLIPFLFNAYIYFHVYIMGWNWFPPQH